MREYRREFSGPRVLAGLLLTCLGLGGCGSNPGTESNSAAVPVGDDGKIVDTSKDGITAYISSGDYLAWGKEPAIRDTVRAHGSQARTYFNSKYLMARRNDVYPMQIGAMAIKSAAVALPLASSNSLALFVSSAVVGALVAGTTALARLPADLRPQ